MATQIIHRLVDDIDGTDAHESVTFGLDGVEYEIDLSEPHADFLREALSLYVANARRVSGRKKASGKASAPGADNSAIREWARKQGLKVGDVGVIRKDIVLAYQLAQREPQAPAPTEVPKKASSEAVTNEKPAAEGTAKRRTSRTRAAQPSRDNSDDQGTTTIKPTTRRNRAAGSVTAK